MSERVEAKHEGRSTCEGAQQQHDALPRRKHGLLAVYHDGYCWEEDPEVPISGESHGVHVGHPLDDHRTQREEQRAQGGENEPQIGALAEFESPGVELDVMIGLFVDELLEFEVFRHGGLKIHNSVSTRGLPKHNPTYNGVRISLVGAVLAIYALLSVFLFIRR